nr:MAG TPA: hypothetical protein [Caudoviricetes sp.]
MRILYARDISYENLKSLKNNMFNKKLMSLHRVHLTL